MNGFDFDNTIYRGESVFDFAFFVVKRKKILLRYLPAFLGILVKYKLCWLDIEELTKALEKYTKQFIHNKELVLDLVEEFWNENIDKIYPHMLKKIKKDDVIITTSPDFLMNGIKDIIPCEHILTSQLDLDKGVITYLNFQTNKVKKFKEEFPHVKLKSFYTDSYNDKPLMEIAKTVYLVKKGKCKKISIKN